MNKSVIYIYLLEEGTDVWRPTEGEMVAEMIFKFLPTPNYRPDNEKWEFSPGSLVRCVYKTLFQRTVLVAVEKVKTI